MLRLFFRTVFRTHKPKPQRVRHTDNRRQKPRRVVSRPRTAPPVPKHTAPSDVLKGRCYVIDGDTVVISGTKIRLAGIDAPELHHPWGRKSKFALISMCKGQVVTARLQEDRSYDRIVAKCYLPDGTDLAAELVKQGLALDWPKFSGGAYRDFEPDGIRKKLWRAAAKQQGRLRREDM